MTFRSALWAAVCLLGQQMLLAQGDPLALIRLSGEITLDGRSNEPAWEAVQPLPLTQMVPVFRGEPSERTEIRIGYSGEYLYAAARCFDSTPGSIRASSLTRDRENESDDVFALLLDTFNDNENGLFFAVNPAGTRIDYAVFNDAQFTGQQGGMPYNPAWNTFWDAAAVVDDQGWFAEIRIPLSSLRFQDEGGEVSMGLLTWRWIGRKAEVSSFPEIPPRWIMGHIKPSVAHDVTLQSVTPKRPVYITPYGLGGGGYAHELNDPETAYDRETDGVYDAGLDVKLGLTSNLTLDLTLNTDFAQVEADDAQINLTRFDLFFPEKRLFFQERSSIFDVSTGGPTRLFYSRRIGITGDGDPVRLYGGARLVGRLGAWDVGAMNMQTAPYRPTDVPSENFGVYRVRRRVFNPHSYAGGMVTSRLGANGSYNTAYGADGIFRLFGDDYLTLNWIQTFDDTTATSSGLDGALASIQYERRTMQGFGFNTFLKYVGPAYNPGMGFNMREDFVLYSGELSYGRQASETSRVFMHNVSVEGQLFIRTDDRVLETIEAGPRYFINLKSGAFLYFRPEFTYENLSEPFELNDDVYVPPGKYRFLTFNMFSQTPNNLLRSMVRMAAGTFYDGWRVTLGAQPVWNLSRYLELGGEIQLNRVGFPDRDQRFSGDVVRLRVGAALNSKLSATSYVQFSSDEDRAIVNVRVRYNPREGNDLYLVYNEGLYTDLDAIPRPPRSDFRAVLVKYTYTFVL